MPTLFVNYDDVPSCIRNVIAKQPESVPSGDGKYRYFKPLRIDMYRKIIGWLRRIFPGMKIELCMDSPRGGGSVREDLG